MKVLIITQHPIFELVGGVQQYVKTLAKFLEKRKKLNVYLASSSITSKDQKISSKITFLNRKNEVSKS
jgi:hypothetical protein